MSAPPVKRVAVIGAGPAGAIAVDALAREQAFDVIRVFERRERAGGCWLYDEAPPTENQNFDFDNLAQRRAVDGVSSIPAKLPTYTAGTAANRYTETATYSYLETNIDTRVMEFSAEPIVGKASEVSIARHGEDTPFKHNSIISSWVAGLLSRNGYEDFVEYNTTVERAEKVDGVWRLTLRKKGIKSDYWWVEEFDALVVASGHYSVPFIPKTSGLPEFARKYPGSVDHSKYFRDPEKYRNKRVLIVGSSVSAGDMATDLIGVASDIQIVSRGKFNAYFGDGAFRNPFLTLRPEIDRIDDRTVIFKDGNTLPDVDNILFGTGFSWTLPFLPNIEIRNNRVPNLYLHIFHKSDPTLTFVGAIGAGLTFRAYEWQSVLISRFLSGRTTLPPQSERDAWEQQRIAKKGDGVPFTMLFPDFEEYFETVRKLAGEKGPGRRLPRFEKQWVDWFLEGHERRKGMWRRNNEVWGRRLVDGAERTKKVRERARL
ncbi:dimethylaniline monooxygenase [Ascodesmis nigricans]|uniref:Dimethylaniline monooxygenase n=1 Tax=Ascodesmis nigricans TaxID=341454 RepID=A0A4S2MIZ3_9PEZI|nr:dimethylaniline monooxygenase [Ascodesmis nigricans]